MNKEQLIEKCVNELYEIEDWKEFNEFCNEQLYGLLKYVSNDGLRNLRSEIKHIREAMDES